MLDEDDDDSRRQLAEEWDENELGFDEADWDRKLAEVPFL